MKHENLVARYAAMLAGVLIVTGIFGCVTLDPNADAFVVRVEQTQVAAGATIDMVLRVDNSDRGFWKTNAPAFHKFCEWLRTPQPYGDQKAARCLVMQLNVHDLKVAYKANRGPGTSNTLWAAWSTLNTAMGQAVSWSNIVTQPIYPR